MKARIFWIVGGAALVLAVVFFATGGQLPLTALGGAGAASNESLETATVTTMTAITSVDSAGTVAPLQSASLAWKTSGTVVTVLVTAGDQVKAGDVLMTLDLSSAPSNVLQAQSEILAAQQALDNLQRPTALAIANAEKAVADARDQLDRAERDLASLTRPSLSHYQDQVAEKERALLTARQNAEKTDLGSVTQALQNARDDLETKTNQLNDARSAQEQCPDCTTVFVNATGRRMSLEQAEQQYQDSVNALRVAEINYEQATSSGQQSIDAAQDALNTAIANLAGAQNDPDALALGQRQATLALAQANLADAEEKLADLLGGPDEADVTAAEVRLQVARATLDSVQLVAPFDGEVLSVKQRPGDPVTQGTAGVMLANRSQLHVVVAVDETEVSAISIGDPVSLTVDAWTSAAPADGQDNNLSGTVGAIETFGETVQGLVRYNVRVDLDNSDPRLFLNMTTNARIITDVQPDALAVPLNAIQFDNQGEYVYRLLAGGGTERVAVISGQAEGELIAVSGNLRPGDTVVMGSPPAANGPGGGFFGGR